MKRGELAKKALIVTLSISMAAAPIVNCMPVYAQGYVDETNLNDEAKKDANYAKDAINKANEATTEKEKAAAAAKDAQAAAEAAAALAAEAIKVYEANEDGTVKTDKAADEVSAAKTVVEDANRDAAEAKTTADNKKTEVDAAANTKVTALDAALDEKQTALDDAVVVASEAAEAAEAAKEVAVEKKEAIEAAVKNGTTDKAGMEKIAAEAAEAATDAETEAAKAAAAEAKALEEYNAAVAAVDTARAELAALEAEYEELAAESNETIAEKKAAAEQAIADAKANIAKLESALNTAEGTYNNATKNSAKAAADAQTAADAAKVAKANAQVAMNDLALMETGKNYETLVNDNTSAKNAYDKAVEEQKQTILAKNAEITANEDIVKTQTDESNRLAGEINQHNNEITKISGQITNKENYIAAQNKIISDNTYAANATAGKTVKSSRTAYYWKGDEISEAEYYAIAVGTIGIGLFWLDTKTINTYYTQSEIDTAKNAINTANSNITTANKELSGLNTDKARETASRDSAINDKTEADNKIGYANAAIDAAKTAKVAADDNVTAKKKAWDDATALLNKVDDYLFTDDNSVSFDLTAEQQEAYQKLLEDATASTASFNETNNDTNTYTTVERNILEYTGKTIGSFFKDVFWDGLFHWDWSFDESKQVQEYKSTEHDLEIKYGGVWAWDTDGTAIMFETNNSNTRYLMVLTSNRCSVKALDDTQAAVYKATFAEKMADNAAKAAADAKTKEAAALAQYKAAQEAVKAAKADLNNVQFNGADADKKVNLQAKLEKANAALTDAKGTYDKAVEESNQAKKDAEDARKAADDAKKAADKVVVPSNNNDPSNNDDDDDSTPATNGNRQTTNLVAGNGLVANVNANANVNGNANVAAADGQVIEDNATPLADEIKDDKKNEEKTATLDDNATPLANAIDVDEAGFNLWWLLLLGVVVVAAGVGIYQYNKSKKADIQD